MRAELRNKIVEENEYSQLLKECPKFIPQGYSMKKKKVVVGIIKGDSKDHKPYHSLDFKYFDSWKEAYIQLV